MPGPGIVRANTGLAESFLAIGCAPLAQLETPLPAC
jgi:hypothetical protein